MNTNMADNPMYESQPAVSGLNMISGFDPRKFMRKTVSEHTRQEIMYLDLKYKKLWFRLAHPRGRIKKTALKITEQIAIIEAKIFLDKDDAEPVSSFIAQRNAIDGKPGPMYIEAAQYAAENQALIDAGFGLQFCDISQEPDTEMLDTGIPVGIANEITAPVSPAAYQKPAAAVVSTEPPAIQAADTKQAAVEELISAVRQESAPAIASVVKEDDLQPVQHDELPLPSMNYAAPATVSQPATVEVDIPPATQKAATVTEAVTEPQETRTSQYVDETPAQIANPSETAAITQSAYASAEMPVQPVSQPSAQAVSENTAGVLVSDAGNVLQMISAAKQPETVPEASQSLSYTADMPVDEILATLTPEEALKIVVDTGTCNGWTLAEVLEKRPASIKWYNDAYPGKNNLLRAGARVLLNTYLAKKAS